MLGIDTSRHNTTVANVTFSSDRMTVTLSDRRAISVPLEWYPRLQQASDGARLHWQPCGAGQGIHWPEIDEDLSIEGLLLGIPSAESKNQ